MEIVQNLKQKYHTVGIVQNLKQKYHTVGIVPKSKRKIIGRDKGDTFNTQNTWLITWTVVYKYMTDHLNRTIQMFGSLEHVVAIKTVSIGQSKVPSSIIYLRITHGYW